MIRLTFAARIGLIVGLAFVAAWVSAVALFYLSHANGGGVRPPPAQVAAAAELIERTPPAERALVLRALTSDSFAPRLDPSSTTPPSPDGRPVTWRKEAYDLALEGRPLSITAIRRRSFPRAGRLMAEGFDFRIGLRGGETLIIETRGLVPVGPVGLPVGLGAGLTGTFIALGALIAMQRETKPLARLAAAADSIDLSGAPVLFHEPGRSAPEIRALIAAFNRLQTRLAQLLKARLAMLGGISHDVRTFATRLRLRAEQIPDSAERDRAIADIDDMIRLLDDSLLASRAGAGGLAEELVDLAELVREDVADRQASGAAVMLEITPSCRELAVLWDRLALRRIVSNLLDNALKYAPSAAIRLGPVGSTVVLIFDDDGPGIPVDRREELLEPFMRLDDSRNRRTGGAGLGLAIVRNLAEAHGGTVVIATSPKGGARVTVRLPLFDATA